MEAKKAVQFEDLLPVMAKKLGGEGLMRELSNGFELLKDEQKGVITVESLKRNSLTLPGLQDLQDDELETIYGQRRRFGWRWRSQSFGVLYFDVQIES